MHPETYSKINFELHGKEFVLQRINRKYRCISWHPHYIMTDWYANKEDAITEGDKKVNEYYKKEVL